MPQHIKVTRTVEHGSWTDDQNPQTFDTNTSVTAIHHITKTDFSRHLDDDDRSKNSRGRVYSDPLGVGAAIEREQHGSPERLEAWEERDPSKIVAL